MVFKRHDVDDTRKMTALIIAVFVEAENLTFEDINIRRSMGFRPKSEAIEGVRFGVHGIEGYLVEGNDAPMIAIDIEFPKRHRHLKTLQSVDSFLYLLTDEVSTSSVSLVIDKAMWYIELLLPDGHPLKREEPPVGLMVLSGEADRKM